MRKAHSSLLVSGVEHSHSAVLTRDLWFCLCCISFLLPQLVPKEYKFTVISLELLQLKHQGILLRNNINNSSMWVAACPIVSINFMWSQWDVTGSNSVRATILNPLSVLARHLKNLWTVMVYEQPPGCFRQWTKLSAGNTSQTEARTFTRAACSLQRMSACLCLIGANWRSMELYRDNKHFFSNITSINK